MVTISIGSPSILDETPIKREKGKSILSVPSEYVVLDLETTVSMKQRRYHHDYR